MKKKLILILLVVFTITNIIAKQSYIDSLEIILKNTIEDTNKIRILLELSKKTNDNQQNKKIKYAEIALQIAEKHNIKTSISKSLNAISLIYISQGYYNKALKYLQRALIESSEIEDKTQQKDIQSAVLINIGNSYLYMGSYKSALEYYFKSLLIAEEIVNNSKIASACNDIGNAYYYLKQYNNAIAFYCRSIDTYKKLKKNKRVVDISINLATIYNEIGNTAEAIKIFKESLSICVANNDKETESICLNNIGYTELNKSNFTVAL